MSNLVLQMRSIPRNKGISCILLIIISLQSYLFGQDARSVDSLYSAVNSGNDTTQINALNELSRIFSETDSQKALQLSFRSLKKASQLGSNKFIAHSLNRIGSVYDVKSMPDSANNYYLQALKIFENLKDKSGIAAVYQNIGVLYYFQEDMDKALEFYKKALELRIDTKEDKYVSKLYNNIGVAYRRQKKFDDAIAYYKKALDIKLKQNDKQAIATTYQNIAVAYQSKKDFSTALSYLNKAVEISKPLNNPRDLSGIYVGLADLFASMGDYKKAGEYARLGVENGLKADWPDLLYNAYEALWIIDTLNNDYKAAVRDLNQAKFYRNKVFKKEKSTAISKLQIIYETEKKDYEINVLNIENETKNRQKTLLYLVIGSITLLLLTLLFFYNKKQKDNRLLTKQKQEILDKTQQLQLQAEEIAKHRSQMNPHFIFNALNSLQGLILSNDTTRSISQLNALSKLMRQTLNNSEKEWISLKEETDYLQNYVDFEIQRFDLRFNFFVNIDPAVDIDNIGIAPMLIQPLIENCLKHAQLNVIEDARISLSIQKLNSKLRIAVEDNGRGRKVAGQSSDSRATGILKKRITELNKKMGLEDVKGLKIVDLKDDKGNGAGTICEFEIPYFELF